MDTGTRIPPDTMGAAGPSHLVEILNSGFGIFNKATGAKITEIPLEDFWPSLGNGVGEPAQLVFDPKILYDQYAGRFVAVTLGGQAAPDSWILVAVSETSDPTGNWDKWAIDADKDGSVQTDGWADYPGLGIDNGNVYVTANMFYTLELFGTSKIWRIPRAQLLVGSPTLTWIEFGGLAGSGPSRRPAPRA